MNDGLKAVIDLMNRIENTNITVPILDGTPLSQEDKENLVAIIESSKNEQYWNRVREIIKNVESAQ